MKFTAYLSSASLICKDGGNSFDWNEDEKPDIVAKKEFDTFEEAYKHIVEEGSRWYFYNAAFIETEEDGEVYSCVPSLWICPTCKHEVYDTFEHIDPRFKKIVRGG